MVFGDEAARRDLEAILHPRIFAELRRRIAERPADAVQVVEAALLVESAPWATRELQLDALVVVESDPELQGARLVQRGMSEEDARRRIASQIDPVNRRAAADSLIANNGTMAELETAFEVVWQKIERRFKS